MSCPNPRHLLLVAALVVLSAPAQAQRAPAGYKTYENKLAPLKFFYPTTYKEIPLPPTEQVLQAKYVRRSRPAELRRVDDRLYKSLEPQIYVYLFQEEAPVTGGEKAAGEKPGAPSSVREAMEKANLVRSWTTFIKRFQKWNLEEKDEGWWRLSLKSFSGADEVPVGYLFRKKQGLWNMGVFGFTLSPHERSFGKRLVKMASSLDLAKEDRGDWTEARIDDIYDGKAYAGIERRKKVRSELAKGWKAVDTHNFIIVHHSRNDALINKIARDIEAMREVYTKEFPPAGKIDAVSIVRVCETRDEYLQYGGREGTGGYWHPGNEELVFFDYSQTMRDMDAKQRRRMNRTLTDRDSMLVLYHEALHQYIYYAVGAFSPHDWFNEGFGDYFSGAVIPSTSTRVKRIGPSPWRIHIVKEMMETGKGYVALEKLLKAERPEFYNRARISHYYAAAWSFIYFLKNADAVEGNPRWSSLLQDYFLGLKASYAEEIQKSGPNPDLRAKQIAGHNARQAALKKVLDGLDLPTLETEWREWVKRQRDPWASRRKK